MRIAYFDCFSGISGDMCLGALVSAGGSAEELRSLPGRLGLDGVDIVVSEARRGPFAATRVEVRVEGRQPHRHLHHVTAILDHAEIAPEVRERAHRVFRRLAEAEAEVHGSTVEKVHFHEVGRRTLWWTWSAPWKGSIASASIEFIPPRCGSDGARSIRSTASSRFPPRRPSCS